MKVRLTKECDRVFDFFSRRQPKAGFPVLAWGAHIITQVQDGKDVVSLNPQTTNLPQLIFDLYPDLSLVELANLEENLRALDLDTFPKVLEKYNLNHSENLSLTLDILRGAPEDFRSWAHERRVSVRDLAPLRCEVSKEFVFVLEQIVRSRATRQQGAQILEIAVELHLNDTPLSEVMSLSDSAEIWLAYLKKIRYPLSTSADREMQNKVKSMPWPNHVEAEWQRRGDQAGVQIRFFAQSETELNRHLENLRNMKSPWTN
ncbi:MAG: hypothetical protein A4S09_07310 [Proteobacteria bacterium SG_bin7]|nr:MAG: hypothetical protein A4S09_07310 [Proteobacteria bacterium SG_bin7]